MFNESNDINNNNLIKFHINFEVSINDKLNKILELLKKERK